MPKKELKVYSKWFHGVLPQRIQELTAAVNSSSGYEHWNPDETPDSLQELGAWMANEVETRPRTSEERGELIPRSSRAIEVEDWELTNRTFSIAIDVGMYFSRVLLRNNPSLRWEQPFGSRNFADYGQPVLVEFASGPLNPVGIAVTLAYGYAVRGQGAGRLRELYDIWAKMIKK